jgi:hypothetical protein
MRHVQPGKELEPPPLACSRPGACGPV